MGKLKRFDIVFDNTQGVFFAGQLVSGTVCVELGEAMKMRGEIPVIVSWGGRGGGRRERGEASQRKRKGEGEGEGGGGVCEGRRTVADSWQRYIYIYIGYISRGSCGCAWKGLCGGGLSGYYLPCDVQQCAKCLLVAVDSLRDPRAFSPPSVSVNTPVDLHHPPPPPPPPPPGFPVPR